MPSKNHQLSPMLKKMNYPYTTAKLGKFDLAFDTALKTAVTPAKYAEYTKFGNEVTLA